MLKVAGKAHQPKPNKTNYISANQKSEQNVKENRKIYQKHKWQKRKVEEGKDETSPESEFDVILEEFDECVFSDEDLDSNADWLYSGMKFNNDVDGDECVRCEYFAKWAHSACAGNDTPNNICDLCVV